MLAKARPPFNIEFEGFRIIDAIMDPIAMVEAKSKLEILAKVRKPEILVIKITNVNIARTVIRTFAIIGNDA